jgi:hypothetical protein
LSNQAGAMGCQKHFIEQAKDLLFAGSHKKDDLCLHFQYYKRDSDWFLIVQKERVFQYKVLNNVLYLNKKLFLFGLSETSNCPFCNAENEDTSHLFYDCPQTRGLWLAL